MEIVTWSSSMQMTSWPFQESWLLMKNVGTSPTLSLQNQKMTASRKSELTDSHLWSLNSFGTFNQNAITVDCLNPKVIKLGMAYETYECYCTTSFPSNIFSSPASIQSDHGNPTISPPKPMLALLSTCQPQAQTKADIIPHMLTRTTGNLWKSWKKMEEIYRNIVLQFSSVSFGIFWTWHRRLTTVQPIGPGVSAPLWIQNTNRGEIIQSEIW